MHNGIIHQQIELYKNVGVLPIWIVKFNVLSVGPSSERNIFLSDKGPTLETLNFTIHVGSTPTFSNFDLYLNTAYAAHYIYIHQHVDITKQTDYLWWFHVKNFCYPSLNV